MSKKQELNFEMREGERYFGFLVKRIEEVKQLKVKFYELEHDNTGARYVHLANNDSENVFCVAFKTVPTDSTGVAHILEHTVLSGSRNYDVKDAFFSMIKRSLNTFMNAFTADDWTAYPFATQNKKDFYNLMSVYLDAAFFPRISKLSFMQEGCRLEYDDNRLSYKGVVYNEMKGVMSSVDRVMSEAINSSIFPTSTYGYNSGGDPVDVPKLTYEQLKEFHRRHYHPSNSFFYSYGDMNLLDHLKFIEDKVLKGFEKIDPKTEITHENRWDEEKVVEKFYPVVKGKEEKEGCQVAISWLQASVNDSVEVLALDLIEDILIGNSASVLRKALIDSGLGTDLSDDSGYNSEYKDTMFSCGLKGVKYEDVGKVESLVVKTLESLIKNGVNKRVIDSAIHKMELAQKEVSNHPYPYGLALFLLISGVWLHGGDVLDSLRFEKDLRYIREKVDEGGYLEGLIAKYFVKNKHKLVLVLRPDSGISKKDEERVEKELRSIENRLSKEEKELIINDARSLKKLQESEQDLSCLPTLELSDVPLGVEKVESVKVFDNLRVYDQPTNGIYYFSAMFNLKTLPEKYLPLLPLFCYVLPKMGTKNVSYEELLSDIDLYTGGVSVGCSSFIRQDKDRRTESYLSFGSKCLVANCDKMFEIMNDIVLNCDFSRRDLLKNFILEFKTKFESQVVESGHVFAASLAGRSFSDSAYLSELWHGVSQLEYLKREVCDNLEERLDGIIESLRGISREVLVKNEVKMSLIGESEYLGNFKNRVSEFYNSLREGSREVQEIKFGKGKICEAWTLPSSVSFVASLFETVSVGHPDAPAVYVLSKILSTQYMLPEIREKRGAYGGFAKYDYLDGVFSMGSYRDPHVLSTLNIFSGVKDFLNSGAYGDEEVKEAILQCCSDIDRPSSPADKAKKDFARKLIGYSNEKRDEFKKGVLLVSKERVLEVAKKYFDKNWIQCNTVVISNEEKIKNVNSRMEGHELKVREV